MARLRCCGIRACHHRRPRDVRRGPRGHRLRGRPVALFGRQRLAHLRPADIHIARGYRLRLGAGGKVLRSWVVQYRHAGATRRLLLGAAEVLGTDAARAMARKALGRVANGADPQAERSDRRANRERIDR